MQRKPEASTLYMADDSEFGSPLPPDELADQLREVPANALFRLELAEGDGEVLINPDQIVAIREPVNL